jgi:homopolymeric O-antigen transport system ATP-binding protein
MSTAIKVENLSKKYLIKHEKETGQYETFADALIQGSKNIAKKIIHPRSARKKSSNTNEEFWALRDINFEINQGDKVGIIGRNGAGKSTLLKVLSRITEPTTGRIHINGRIASLLEVGTGFHPELTGRENIYLNGAILGMSRQEIRAKFDEIVDFSEVAKFLDTPVKRYSSGMYVRLAFAVAANLEPEILVVDEVLAVGDADFQKKCLGKMGDVSREGRTVLFVSHNMNAIEKLCDHAIWIDNGQVATKSNDVNDVIQKYLSSNSNDIEKSEWINSSMIFNDPHFTVTRFAIEDDSNKVLTQSMSNNDDVKIIIEGNVENIDKALQVGYALYNDEGSLIYWSLFNDGPEESWPKVEQGINKFVSYIPKRFLNQGNYRVDLIVALYFRYWIIEPNKNSPCIYFTIQGGLSDSPYWMIRRPGLLAPELGWKKG